MSSMHRTAVAVTAGIGLALLADSPGMTAAAKKAEAGWKGSIRASGLTVSEQAKKAKLTLREAISAARGRAGGVPVRAELGAVRGYLVFTVGLVQRDGSVAEVTVDAGKEKILEVAKDADEISIGAGDEETMTAADGVIVEGGDGR